MRNIWFSPPHESKGSRDTDGRVRLQNVPDLMIERLDSVQSLWVIDSLALECPVCIVENSLIHGPKTTLRLQILEPCTDFLGLSSRIDQEYRSH